MPHGTSSDLDAAAPDDAMRLENQLSFAIYSNANKISRMFRPFLEPFELTFPQYLTLLTLWSRAPRTVTELARALNLEANTVTPLLKRLESTGYVIRQRDRIDERRVQISLTPKGEDFRAQAAAIRARLFRDVALPEKDVADLRATLQNLSRQIDLATVNQAAAAPSTVTSEGLPAVGEDD